jgi:tetratricopeptide (TPR) repeat protein
LATLNFPPLVSCRRIRGLNSKTTKPAPQVSRFTFHVSRSASLSVLLFLSTVAIYLPTLQNDFLTYDDQVYVTENFRVQAGFTKQGLLWAFGYHASNWHPLTWISHMLDCQLYGLHPAGHHLTNVLLHAANSVLLFLFLSRTTAAVWRSAFVAILFAFHPMHVESVAWIAERKDVLSAFFFLLTLITYDRYVRSRIRNPAPHHPATPSLQHSTCPPPPFTIHHSRLYILPLLLFTLALLSKPMAVTLPFVLVLLDCWPLKRLDLSQPKGIAKQLIRLAAEKIPFLALSVVASILTLAAQKQAMVSTAGLPIYQRIAHALLAYVHYLGAMFLPRHLAIYYPYEPASAGTALLSFLLLAFISFLALRFARTMPYLPVGWFWYLGMLVPVIGLVQVGEQAWADRYTYLPLVGLFIAVVWTASELLARKAAPSAKLISRILAVAVAIPLLILTSLQITYWKSTRSLFQHAADVTKDNYMAINLLGSLDAKEGRLDEALKKYDTALRLRPGYPEARFCRANALDELGKIDEAIAEYKHVLWYKPIQEQTHILLGTALAKQKKFDEATAHYLAALKLNPDSLLAHNNYAKLLQTQGRLDDAVEHYTAALKLDPKLPQAHNNLGVLLVQRGNLPDGLAQLRQAVSLQPTNSESQFNLALALNQQGQWNEAAEWFAKSVGPNTTDPNPHYQYGLALAHQSKRREAMSQYATALLLRPDFPDALDGLAWLLATAPSAELRNGVEAVRMAERACELTGRQDPQKLKTLAAAYAETGNFPQAIATLQPLVSAHPDLAPLLRSFQSNSPWRE